MQPHEEGLTLLQVSRRLGFQPKRILSYEYNGFYEPPFRRKGKRMVRFYPPTLVDLLARAVALIQRGYGPKLAFFMAQRGELPAEQVARPHEGGVL